MGSDEVVRTDRDGPVLRVVLDRPDKLNALSGDVLDGLVAVVDALQDDLDIRVVVLSGEGRAFSAGADLVAGPGTQVARDATWAQARHRSGAWQRLLDRFEALSQVTVAKLHGHCIGGAVLLAAACDLRIADTSLRVRIPELAIGIPLTWGGNPRLVREIGLPLARDLVMTGREMEGYEALRCGFVQRLVPAEELDAAVTIAVEELTAMPDGPLRITKAMFAAIGRERMGAAGWADADLLRWSGTEAKSRDAATGYAARRLQQ